MDILVKRPSTALTVFNNNLFLEYNIFQYVEIVLDLQSLGTTVGKYYGVEVQEGIPLQKTVCFKYHTFLTSHKCCTRPSGYSIGTPCAAYAFPTFDPEALHLDVTSRTDVLAQAAGVH